MIMVQVANLLKPRLKNCTILPYSVRQERVIRTAEVQVMRKLASPLGGKSCKEYAAICNPPTSHLHYTIPFSDLSSWYSPRYEFEVLDMSETNFPLGPLSLFYNNFIFFFSLPFSSKFSSILIIPKINNINFSPRANILKIKFNLCLISFVHHFLHLMW